MNWAIAFMLPILATLIIVTVLGWQDAAADRARAACDGARDTRRVIVEMLEFTGTNQIDPDDYTGEVRDAIIQSQRRAQEFRDTQITALERPPPQCQLIKAGG